MDVTSDKIYGNESKTSYFGQLDFLKVLILYKIEAFMRCSFEKQIDQFSSK